MSQPIIPRGAPGRRPGPPAPPIGDLKPGAVVFFPACKKTAKPNGQSIAFRGHGFGVFLGVVPNNFPEPSRAMMPTLLSAIGWISFTDIVEFLGEDSFKIIETKFREKYSIPDNEEAAKPAEPPQLELPAEKRLVGLDGAPIASKKKPGMNGDVNGPGSDPDVQ